MNSPDVPAIIQMQPGAPVTPGIQRPSEDEAMRALIEEITRRLQTDPEYLERARQLEQGGNPLERVPPPQPAPGPGSQNEFVLQRLLALLSGGQ